MADEYDYTSRSSVYVAPLQIVKSKRSSSGASRRGRTHHTSAHSARNQSVTPRPQSSQNQITPPPTPIPSSPQVSFENSSSSQHTAQSPAPENRPPSPSQELVYHFLRAFFPFQANLSNSNSNTVTLPLNEGDIILVHSVHTNGWADGTMLSSGSRGWLPTNYCEGYDLDQIRPLLRACLNLFNQCRGGGTHQESQGVVTGVVAGVRFLLESTDCLTRESEIVQSHERIKKLRKLLLSDLSSLVKAAKRIPDHAISTQDFITAEDLIDEMVLRTFKIVVRGVSFLDIWFEETQNDIDDVIYGSDSIPPTPPSESASTSFAGSTASLDSPSESNADYYNNRAHVSVADSGYQSTQSPYSSMVRSHSPLPEAYSRAQTPAFEGSAYALAQLNTTHDILLSYLASYIGRLQLQSRSPREIHSNTQKSASAAQDLLAVVEAIHARDPSASTLDAAKKAMYGRVMALISATREALASRIDDDDEGVIVRDDGKKLMLTATGCVRGAGECVAKAKYVLDRIGDFELDEKSMQMGYEFSRQSSVSSTDPKSDSSDQDDSCSDQLTPRQEIDTPKISAVTTSEDQEPMSPPPLPAKDSVEKPLPLLPPNPTAIDLDHRELPPLPESPESVRNVHSRQASVKSIIHCSQSLSAVVSDEAKPLTVRPKRAESSVAEDQVPLPESTLQSCATSIQEDTEGVYYDPDLLTVTYAHELVYNKEGQVTGGSLAALVEKLTAHDGTPDAVFVSTFYLTFRIFTTPLNFARALVDRYDSVDDNAQAGTPVRLRVYNVFKQWMESHWRKECDTEALATIQEFAAIKLTDALPTAGKRLEALAKRVSSIEGPLVPRLVSSMGGDTKFVLPDTPIPAPSISRGQMNMLRAALSGSGPQPSFLDFDPAELARQFTLKESRMICSILPEELLGLAWTKKDDKLAVNVRAMSALSTDLANLVAETILAQEDHKRRALVIKHWIKIADKCLELNNYDSLMAIMCTMNASTIVRLKKTWECVSSRTKVVLEKLRAILDVSKNHAVLRARLRAHVPPTLPFLGTYLTDLTFTDVGNPNVRPLTLEDGTVKELINFDKHVRTARIISDLQRFQIPYRIAEVPELQQWIEMQLTRIHNSKCADVSVLYRRSLLLEPRETNTTQPSPVETPAVTPSIMEKFDFFNWTGSSSKYANTTTLSPASSSLSLKE